MRLAWPLPARRCSPGLGLDVVYHKSIPVQANDAASPIEAVQCFFFRLSWCFSTCGCRDGAQDQDKMDQCRHFWVPQWLARGRDRDHAEHWPPTGPSTPQAGRCHLAPAADAADATDTDNHDHSSCSSAPPRARPRQDRHHLLLRSYRSLRRINSTSGAPLRESETLKLKLPHHDHDHVVTSRVRTAATATATATRAVTPSSRVTPTPTTTAPAKMEDDKAKAEKLAQAKKRV